MTVYERNFQRLTRIVPELFAASSCAAALPASVKGMNLDVLESHKYTTVLKLSQDLPFSFASAALAAMTVRVYHDARVAEVLSYQNHFRFNPKYEYPNPKMCQVREKQRVNDFLGEWLEYCWASVRADSLSASS